MPSNYSSSRSNRARKIVAAQLPTNCIRCNRIVTAEMKWEADHIISRAAATALGLDLTQVDDASNLGASHASCNHKANARPKQTKAERVEKRIQKVSRPSFFLTEPRTPAAAPQVSSPEAAQDGS